MAAPAMPDLLEQLAGGDRRTLGRSAEVAAQVLAQPAWIDRLFDGLAEDDAVIRGRAADALEKVSAARPDLIQPYKAELLTQVVAIDDWVVRAHLCQILPRLGGLTPAERRRALATVHGYLADRSSIVRALALECLVHLSRTAGFSRERKTVDALVLRLTTAGGTPALRARARKMQRFIQRAAADRGRGRQTAS